MKFIYILFLVTIVACQSEKTSSEVNNEASTIAEVDSSEVNGYDSLLAQKYGADQYGMKPYVMAFLKTGPNAPKDSAHSAELQAAHMNNIGRLAEEGKLVVAGPFYGEAKGDLRGIYVFNTKSIDSARAFTESDPAIQYGSLKMELINWYGSAAMMSINDTHNKIAKENP